MSQENNNNKDKPNNVVINKNPWGNPSGGNKPENQDNKGSGGNKSNRPVNGGFGGGFDIEKLLKRPYGGGSGGGFKNDGFKITPKKILAALSVIGLLWLSNGIFMIGPEEEGVVLRFGKYDRKVASGLDFHMPYPFEQLIKVPVTKLNSVEVGFRSGGLGGRNNSGEKRVPEESLMITGDTNIADVSFEVQWIIKDSEKFLFNVKEPERTIKAVAESTMREIIGRTSFDEATSEGRAKIETDAKASIQAVLDNYNAGIEVLLLQLRPVQNPAPVMDAFLDVETAKQDKQTAINRAKAYANDIIPRARGDAEKQIQEAEAYKAQVVSIASGEAQRFASVLKEYNVAKDVTKRRIYLETMQQILSGTNKIIIDQKGAGNVMPYLPLQELKKKESDQTAQDKTN